MYCAAPCATVNGAVAASGLAAVGPGRRCSSRHRRNQEPDAVLLKKLRFEMRPMTWRAKSGRPYAAAGLFAFNGFFKTGRAWAQIAQNLHQHISTCFKILVS